MVALPRDDGSLYVFASADGAPKNPDWYRNLVAHPHVEVEFGGETFGATASPITGDERDRLYAEQAAVMPGFGDYETKTAGLRVIPVVRLTRD